MDEYATELRTESSLKDKSSDNGMILLCSLQTGGEFQRLGAATEKAQIPISCLLSGREHYLTDKGRPYSIIAQGHFLEENQAKPHLRGAVSLV